MKKRDLLAVVEEQEREIEDLKRRIEVLEGARLVDAIGKITIVPLTPTESGTGWPPTTTSICATENDPNFDYYELTNTSGERIIGRYPKLPEGTIQVFNTC